MHLQMVQTISQALSALMQRSEVLWGESQETQIDFMHLLYDKMLDTCNMGDWDLGFRQHVQSEDGLACLVAMCGCVGRGPPALALHVLLTTIRRRSTGPAGSINFTRLGHVLSKLAHWCVKPVQMRLRGSMVNWLVLCV
jgi:hypothetical protein